jgi:DNA (cytosine-5)-methyltransferase 1
MRYFSARESARLQTFPDDFLFPGDRGETHRQLGNAVPVRLATIAAMSVRE